MARETNELKKRSGADLRALAEQRMQEQLGPAVDAERHEALFLKGIGSAQQEFDWLIEHAAWTHLGFGSVVEWWDSRVRPVMVELEMRPTPEMVDKILAAVREAERALPAPQRRTQRELASLVRASDWKVRGRSDPRNRRSAAGSDLDDPPADRSPLVNGIRTALEDVEESQRKAAALEDSGSGGTSPSAGPGENTPADPLTPQHADEATTDDEHRADVVVGQPEQNHPEAAATGEVEAPASTPPDVEGYGTGDETDPDGVPPQESGEVDREQESAGVPAPAPTPVALLEELAEKFEALDVDVLAPLMTSVQLDAMQDALKRLTFSVGMFETWYERAAS